MSTNLTGHLLIAMPGMGDPRFAGAVVFLCDHSDEGAMGLIINKPVSDLSFAQMIGQLGIEAISPPKVPVLFGGPVETGRGFVLHSDDYDEDGNTMHVVGGFGMTATLDVLEDLAHGDGPEQAVMALGYAGWAPGQLEAEIQQNGWLTCDADAGIVFGRDMDGKWEAALKKLGVSPLMLSADAGRA
ncbi:YqgE/AlgH family protein [Nioella nitratireducens]|uniref:YqgE/AlgH family protein n=1 Tax=Nioella nitratireducens TaxID=1287720 RepID=UPI0008FCEB3D|nr:YqgE/AlgH family protein [Nioella nitratireducens]